jgi:hypothetical protein
LDGAYYDFQGAGEFFALKSINDNSINIQTRFEPCAPGVTCMVGLSVTVGANNVSISYLPAPRVLRVFSNNVDVTSSLPLTLSGVQFSSSTSQYGATQYVVTDAAHGILVTILDYYYLSTTFCVSTSLYDQVNGLLGRFDGNPNNDNPNTQSSGFATSSFVVLSNGESWRVSEDESTTHYGVNESYATINDPDFVQTVFDGSFMPSSAAQTACASLTGQFLTACLQDVTASGDTAFATAAAGFSAFYEDQQNTINGGGSSSDASTVVASFAVVSFALLAHAMKF